ncbi:MAG: hypothetical protein J0M04_22505 [Verrucomicrobia bacterium]|nr:hypothetical protein [Verrucomicrobiota bacterium]
MSFDLSWIASADIPLHELERRMGLKRTGRTCDELESECASIRLSGGWGLVMANRADYLESLDLSSVSNGGCIITLALHDGIMISVADCWTDGEWTWHVEHDGQEYIEHIAAEGDVPVEFTEAKAHCERSLRDFVPVQAPASPPQMPAAERAIFERMGMTVMPWSAPNQKVDFHFDIPIDLAARVVGFRHGRSQLYFELESETMPIEEQ